MIRSSAVPSTALAAAIAASCVEAPAQLPGAREEPPTAEEGLLAACDQLFETYCKATVGCSIQDGEAGLCHPVFRERHCAALVEDVQAGLTHFDVAQLEACRRAWADPRACRELQSFVEWGQPRACESVVTGRREVGATCASDLHCLSGRCGGGSCPGVCEAEVPVVLGDCRDDWDCGGEMVCHPHTWTCGDPLPPGATCDGRETGPCEGPSWARTGYRCVPAPGVWTGTCEPAAGVGEACDSWFDCDIDLECDGSVCVEDGRTGDACRHTKGWMGCADGFYCDPHRGCQQNRLPHDECRFHTECPATFRCRQGTCEPGPVVGELCDRNFACVLGACVSRRCTMLANGELCKTVDWDLREYPHECASGVCRGTCAPGLPEGGACSDDSQCADFLGCTNGTCQTDCSAPWYDRAW